MKSIKTDQPCPCGKSSDGYAIYSDGHGYCFSHKCGQKYFSLKERMQMNIPKDGEYREVRGITEDVCRLYNITVYTKNNKIIGHKYKYNDNAAKFRNVTAKEARAKGIKTDKPSFVWYGDTKNAGLFGQHLFNKGQKAITITEGELDAPSAFMLLGSKYPVVSLPDGSESISKVKQQYEYLNSFETIVICLDQDEAGIKGATKIAKLFPGKAKIMKLNYGKDPNEYLQNKFFDKFKREWWQAELYTPTDIITGAAIKEAALQQPARGVSLIWPALTNITRGIRPHELWTFLAGSGMGKTSLFHEIGYHLMVQEDKKCGFILLEEPPSMTAKQIYGRDLNLRLHLEDYDVDREEFINKAPNSKLIENNAVVLDHQGVSDWEEIEEKIKYFVTALGCEYILFDHVTAAAEGKERDVNSFCHYILEKTNQLLMGNPFSMFMISHIRKSQGTPAEEGGRIHMDDAYGSGAIKQRSHFVFGLEGNQQSEDEEERKRRQLRCLKDRYAGSGVGKKVELIYDYKTGRLKEEDD